MNNPLNNEENDNEFDETFFENVVCLAERAGEADVQEALLIGIVAEVKLNGLIDESQLLEMFTSANLEGLWQLAVGAVATGEITNEQGEVITEDDSTTPMLADVVEDEDSAIFTGIETDHV